MNILKETFPTFSDDLKCQLKWLEENKSETDKITGIKQQKFLLFYNLFLKINDEQSNFEGLCAWKGGPVYTQVHAAVKHHFTIKEIINSIEDNVSINESLANISKFIVELLSDEEVSDLTHKFDFWTTIDDNYKNNKILEENISKDDEKKIFEILNFYDLEFINNHNIYKTETATFFIKKNEYDFILKEFGDKLRNIKNNKPIKIDLESNTLKKQETKKLVI